MESPSVSKMLEEDSPKGECVFNQRAAVWFRESIWSQYVQTYLSGREDEAEWFQAIDTEIWKNQKHIRGTIFFGV